MTDVVLHAERLSKQYRLGVRRDRYRTARDTIAAAVTAPRRWGRPQSADAAAPEEDATLWALRDVSFDVRRGEVIGVIGRNGAGKSTLLKVLSRITEPTSGFVDVRGHVTALLEVGSGFHLELTGRENIYLNAAILGMKKREVDNRLDEIVAFAEVARFLDTPVKHYSSGMYLRLAFSVAAHLRPDILMVDEVLAVGDAAFQRKCLGKMEDVANEHRTVLFVSHNLGAIKRLCHTCLVLANGRVAFWGPVQQALAFYSESLLQPDDPGSHSGVGLRHVTVGATTGQSHSISNSESFVASCALDLSITIASSRLYCIIDDSNGEPVVHHVVDAAEFSGGMLVPGTYGITATCPPLWLMPDAYTLHFKLLGRSADGHDVRCVSERALLDVTDPSGQSAGKVRSVLIPPMKWQVRRTHDTKVARR